MGKHLNPSGNEKTSPGRPTLPEHEKKKSRSLTVSDQAWESLEGMLKDLGVKSVSELVEKIGLEQISVVSTSEKSASDLANIPMYRRLKFFLQPPGAVLMSSLAFVRRTADQLGVGGDEEFLCGVMTRAIAVVFLIGYTHPDTFVNNPSALLRWVSYSILRVEAQNQVQHISPTVSNPETKTDGLTEIRLAIGKLNTASYAPHYRVLKMKAMDGLTIGQVIRIFELQSYHKEANQVARMLKKGLRQFRELWEKADNDPDAATETDQEIKGFDKASFYCSLAIIPALTKDDQLNMEILLIKAGDDPILDFWINEIDYYYGFVLSQNAESYEEKQEILRRKIDRSIDEYLLKKKSEVDGRLATCSSKLEIQDLLSRFVQREVGQPLPLEILLGTSLSDFIDIVQSLESILRQEHSKPSLEQYVQILKRKITSSNSDSETTLNI